MKTHLACLSLAAFACAACDKSETKAKPEHTSSHQPSIETRADAPAIEEKTAPARSDTPDAGARMPIDPPLTHPVTDAMIRPAGIRPDDPSWESLTPEQKVGKFASGGIARMPKDISDRILAETTKTDAPEDQLNLITRQAAAWHHINTFSESESPIPDHMRRMLLERLTQKHGDAWINMVPELDEQIAASAKVDELRAKGIPGISADESHEVFIRAIEKYGADYKAILSAAEQAAQK